MAIALQEKKPAKTTTLSEQEILRAVRKAIALAEKVKNGKTPEEKAKYEKEKFDTLLPLLNHYAYSAFDYLKVKALYCAIRPFEPAWWGPINGVPAQLPSGFWKAGSRIEPIVSKLASFLADYMEAAEKSLGEIPSVHGRAKLLLMLADMCDFIGFLTGPTTTDKRLIEDVKTRAFYPDIFPKEFQRAKEPEGFIIRDEKGGLLSNTFSLKQSVYLLCVGLALEGDNSKEAKELRMRAKELSGVLGSSSFMLIYVKLEEAFNLGGAFMGKTTSSKAKK